MYTFHSAIEKPFEIPVMLVFLCLASSCATQEVNSATPKAEEVAVAAEQKPTKPEIKTTETATPNTPAPTPAPEPAPKTRHVNPSIYLGSDGKLAGRGSPDRPASEVIRIARGVHPQALSLPGLPKDKFGLIDWNSMIQKKVIKPLDSLQPGAPEIPPFDMDVLINTKGFVKDVMFRHKPHTYWLDCQNCHTGIFIMGKGKNKMSMQEIVQGQWCGRCHGKVSFPLTDCTRCHSQAKN